MKPANVILDLLRTYPRRGTSTRSIMAAGRLFGFSENLIRVTLSRLVRKDMIENFRRGYYRLSDRTDPLNDFVEEWRLGEARRKGWDERSWLLVRCEVKADDKSSWALRSNGFHAITAGLWMRPDNLAIDHLRLEQRLRDLGSPSPFVLMSGAQVSEIWQRRWTDLIDVDALTRRYHTVTRQLGTSLARLAELPKDQGMRESFNLGGTAIQVLAKDPLLPEQIQDRAPRERLCSLMLLYDKAGRDVWAGKDRNIPDATPISQTEIA